MILALRTDLIRKLDGSCNRLSLLITPVILPAEKHRQSQRQQGAHEERGRTNRHSLNVKGAVMAGEDSSPEKRTRLADHAEDGETSTTLRGGALVVGHPGKVEGDRGENTAGDKVHTQIADGSRFKQRQQEIAHTADTDEEDDEHATLSNAVRN